MKNTLLAIIFSIILSLSATGCIEDGFATSPSAQPVFSTDTLDLGETFTLEQMPRAEFLIYNRHDKILNLSSVTIRESAEGVFRMNVDGLAGRHFENVEIRPGDSIYVLVDATLPANASTTYTEVTGHLDVAVNGRVSTVVLRATGIDAVRHRAERIAGDVTWSADLPHVVFDSLVVEQGATLRLPAGTNLHFHDKARLTVHGSLITEGTPEAPVVMTGDRLGRVVGSIPFDLMASQWEGVTFSPGSTGNTLSHTVIKNTCTGVLVDSLASVDMLNCRLRNSAGYALESRYATLSLIGCEIADASLGAFSATGGSIDANHCTFASYYLFTAPRGPIVSLSHLGTDDDGRGDDGSGLPFMHATFSNSIFYGLGTDFQPTSLAGSDVSVRNCVLKSAGTDDDNFISCLWDTDPLFTTVRDDYYFDYRLLDDSQALGAADPTLTSPRAAIDFFGTARGESPRPGAYQGSGEESPGRP